MPGGLVGRLESGLDNFVLNSSRLLSVVIMSPKFRHLGVDIAAARTCLIAWNICQ